MTMRNTKAELLKMLNDLEYVVGELVPEKNKKIIKWKRKAEELELENARLSEHITKLENAGDELYEPLYEYLKVLGKSEYFT